MPQLAEDETVNETSRGPVAPCRGFGQQAESIGGGLRTGSKHGEGDFIRF
jgi:hypothetical protein